MTRTHPSPAVSGWHRLTAVVLAAMMAWLGWFTRSESAHDFLHFHPASAPSLRVVQTAHAGSQPAVSTQTPRWLKVASAPAGSQVPAGPHRHRNLAFDSLAAGLWCGLFAPAVVPMLDLPVVAGLVPPPLVAPLRMHWVLLPGRAPPVCALSNPA